MYTFAHLSKDQAVGWLNKQGSTDITDETVVFVGGAKVERDEYDHVSLEDVKDGVYAQGKYWPMGATSNDITSTFKLSDHTNGRSSGDDYAVKLKNDQLFVTVPTNTITPEDPGNTEPTQSIQYKFEFAFAVVYKSNQNPTKPVGNVPSTGQTRGGVTWYPTGPNNVAEDHYTWMTTRSVVVGGSGNESWDTPFIIGYGAKTGEDGIHGINGDKYEYIYTRTTYTNSAGGYPLTLPSTIRTKSEYSKGNAVTDEDFVPSDWTDNPKGVSAELQFEWQSIRRGKYDATGRVTFSEFTTPTLWSKYGVNGTDGDGFDYIFALQHEGDTLPTPTPNNWNSKIAEFQKRDYILPAQKDNPWCDDAPEMTTPGDRIMYCTRMKYIDDENTGREDARAYWHKYSEPKLWAYYAKNGNDGHNADDPTPTHPAVEVITSDTMTENDFRTGNDFLDNVLYIVKGTDGKIRFWAIRTNGVWQFMYPTESTQGPSFSLSDKGDITLDQWRSGTAEIDGQTVNVRASNIFVTIKDDGKIVGYGIGGMFVSIPQTETPQPDENSVIERYNYAEFVNGTITLNDGVWYIFEGPDSNGVQVCKLYYGSQFIADLDPGSGRYATKDNFQQMLGEVNWNKELTDKVWSAIDTNSAGTTWGTYKSGLNDVLSDFANVRNVVTDSENGVIATAAHLGDLITTVDEQGNSIQTLDSTMGAVQATLAAITYKDDDGHWHAAVDSTITDLVTGEVESQIEQLGDRISLKVAGDNSLCNFTVNGDQVSIQELAWDSEDKEYKPTDRVAFSVNVRDNKIVADADTFVISGDLIANALKSQSLSIGKIANTDNYNFNVSSDGNLVARDARLENVDICGGTFEMIGDDDQAYVSISTDGVLNAQGVNVTGTIHATDGEFTGTITGSTITGGSISIGEHGEFTVDSTGHVKATDINLTAKSLAYTTRVYNSQNVANETTNLEETDMFVQINKTADDGKILYVTLPRTYELGGILYLYVPKGAYVHVRPYSGVADLAGWRIASAQNNNWQYVLCEDTSASDIPNPGYLCNCRTEHPMVHTYIYLASGKWLEISPLETYKVPTD